MRRCPVSPCEELDLLLLEKDKPVLLDVIQVVQLLKVEKKLTSRNLALVLVHDLLLSSGIQAGD